MEDRKPVKSRVFGLFVWLPAPNSTNPDPKPVGEGFGFVVYLWGPRREERSDGVNGDYPNFNLKKKTKLKIGGRKNESEYRGPGPPAL